MSLVLFGVRNVNGLASVVKNGLAVLQGLVERERPDVLCLQETKLQTTYTVQHEGILKGYRSACYAMIASITIITW